jgi:hypothetical protein
MSRPSVVFALIVLASTSACTRSRRPMSSFDDAGSPRVDAGVRPMDDGGVGFDAGSLLDAGPRPDGGGCPEGTTDCEGVCANLSSDRNHCGSCFELCAPTESCIDRLCRSGCTPSCSGRVCGTDGCGGSCGTCVDGDECVEGSCVSLCELPLELCGGTCVDTSSDRFNCGGCGTVCGATESCVDRLCRSAGTPGESCASPTELPASGTATFTWVGRLPNHTPFSCGATSARADVAFRWRPTRTGLATITTIATTGADIDTTVSLFSAATCDSLSELGCDDDHPDGSLDSLLEIEVVAGTTYYLVVGSYVDPAPADTIRITATVL